MSPTLSVPRILLFLGLIASYCQCLDLRWVGPPPGRQLTAETHVHLRVPREAPNIQGEPDGIWITITCRTGKDDSGSSIFLHCPVRSGRQGREGKDLTALLECYQNCAPMKPCQTDADEACVPDGSSINCTQEINADGITSTIFRIDRRDPRIPGMWYCSHRSQRSASVEVRLASEPADADADKRPQTPLRPPPPPPPPLPSNDSSGPLSEVGRQDLSLTVRSSTPTPLHSAFIGLFNHSPWLLALLGIFAVSLLANLIFCVRWCLLCTFTEKRNQDCDEHRTLGDILCLPTRVKGSSSVLWENDIIPAPLSSDFHPGCGLLEDMSPNFRHFSTFTHGYPLEAQVPVFSTEEGRFAFTNGTIKSNQLDGFYRARSGTGFPRSSLPGSRDWSTVRSNRLRGGAAAPDGTPYLVANPLFTDNPAVPAPTPYLTVRPRPDANDTPVLITGETTVPELVLPTSQGVLSTQSSLAGRRGNFRPNPGNPQGLYPASSCGGATVYDDVASSSSVALPLRSAENHPRIPGNRLFPAVTHYLPSMAEQLLVVADESSSLLSPESVDSVLTSVLPDPETNSQKNIYVLHSPPTQLITATTTTTTTTTNNNVDNEPPC
uniref:Uncharacterized protein n=1 Tax=Schistocephalus solidus TaxID=70667 RepID=A0A0X3NSH1_SCHSO